MEEAKAIGKAATPRSVRAHSSGDGSRHTKAAVLGLGSRRRSSLPSFRHAGAMSGGYEAAWCEMGCRAVPDAAAVQSEGSRRTEALIPLDTRSLCGRR